MTKTTPVARLWLIAILFIVSLPTLSAHEKQLSREVLERFFPEAENFVSRQRVFKADEIARIEKLAGDKLHEVDRELLLYIALGIDPQTRRYHAIGAVLMVDAKGSKGLVDLTVGFRLDGSVKKVLVMGNEDDPALESESFLKQFEGRKPDDSWELEKDYKLVGDGQSARAVVLAVRRGMHLMQAVLEK